jgi:hypothetical protein
LHLVSKAKWGRAWLVLGWETNIRETAQRQAGGNAIKVQMGSMEPDLSKITKTKRIKEMVLMHVWLSGIKALPDTNSYFYIFLYST